MSNKGYVYFTIVMLPAVDHDWLIHTKPGMCIDAGQSTVMCIDASQSGCIR